MQCDQSTSGPREARIEVVAGEEREGRTAMMESGRGFVYVSKGVGKNCSSTSRVLGPLPPRRRVRLEARSFSSSCG